MPQTSTASLADDAIARAMAGMTPSLSVADLRRIPDCVKLLDLGGRIVRMSRNGLRAMQVPDEAMAVGRVWSDLWPEAMRRVVRHSVDIAAGGQVAVFTGDCPTLGGEMRSWRVEVTPVRDIHGSVETLLATSRDIS